MADNEDTSAAPDGGTDPGGADGGDRVDRLEDKVDRLAAAVANLIPGSRAEATDRTEQRLDRPSSVEEQVAHALAQAREDDAKRAEQARLAGDVKSVQDSLAALQEKQPAPPIPRRQRALGWKP